MGACKPKAPASPIFRPCPDRNGAGIRLEGEGFELSVLPWEEEHAATRKDLGLQAKPAALPCILISDGVVLRDNLPIVDFDRARLQKELRSRGLRAGDVFLMTVDGNGKITFIPREKK